MDFILSQDQAALRSSIERFCADLKPEQGLAARWAQFAEMGLLGLAFGEDHGGIGGGGVELGLVAEQIGRHLLKLPYVPAVVVAGSLLASLADAERADALLPAVAEGRLVVIPAFYEPGARYDLIAPATTAVAVEGGYRLDGRKAVVIGGGLADLLLVSARIEGGEGVALFLVQADAPGVTRRLVQSLDGPDCAEVRFEAVALPGAARLGGAGQALGAIRAAVERGEAALVAEAVGAMGALFEQTAEYLRTRKQFGQPIGKFQALQHRLVDMKIALELTRSLASAAAMAVDDAEPAERARIVAAARVQAANAGRMIGQQAIQMHGAMGMTDELAIGHYVKRLMVLSAQAGDAAANLSRFMAASGYTGV